MALTCQFLKVCPAPHGPLSAFIAAQQSRQSLIEYVIRAGWRQEDDDQSASPLMNIYIIQIIEFEV